MLNYEYDSKKRRQRITGLSLLRALFGAHKKDHLSSKLIMITAIIKPNNTNRYASSSEINIYSQKTSKYGYVRYKILISTVNSRHMVQKVSSAIRRPELKRLEYKCY